jgi:hypothetical protein
MSQQSLTAVHVSAPRRAGSSVAIKWFVPVGTASMDGFTTGAAASRL